MLAPKPREKRPSFDDVIRRNAGRFLKAKFHATGLSRKEAAEKAVITEGHLTSLLAGRIVLPAQSVLRGMARGWDFPILEYYLTTGLLTEADFDEYFQRRGTLSPDSPSELRILNSRLMALPEAKRQKVVDSFLNTLSLLED